MCTWRFLGVRDANNFGDHDGACHEDAHFRRNLDCHGTQSTFTNTHTADGHGSFHIFNIHTRRLLPHAKLQRGRLRAVVCGQF